MTKTRNRVTGTVITTRFNQKVLILSLSLVFAALFQTDLLGQEQTVALERISADQWRDDLTFMAREMKARHANLFHTVSEYRFDLSVRNLRRRADGLSPLQMILEIEKIVASVRDGHTRVIDRKIQFRRYPLRLYWYSDGLFVQSADERYREAVGARVVRIGKLPVEKAIESVARITPRDNDFSLRDRVPWRLVTPEILAGLGIVDKMERAEFEVERDGRRWVIEVLPLAPAPAECQGLLNPVPAGWVDARKPGASPLWLKNSCETYWFEYLPQEQILYVQVNEVVNHGKLTLTQFFDQVFSVADSKPIARFVLDLRLNSGGNLALLRPIIVGLIQHQSVNHRGRFFTIIGRRTFSAAQYWVDELEKYTETIFVGEPTAQAVNFYSDAEVFQLPNSGIRIGVSSLRWQPMPPWQDRLYTEPNIAAELSSSDYANNRDPVMDAIRHYESANK